MESTSRKLIVTVVVSLLMAGVFMFALTNCTKETAIECDGISYTNLSDVQSEGTSNRVPLLHPDVDRGNSNGNIHSGLGMVAERNGWIYHSEELLAEHRLVRICSENGFRENIMITEYPVRNINVMENTIIFTLSKRGEGTQIYRMNPDGSDLKRLGGTKDVRAFEVHVAGDWIIFTNFGLYRMSTDGQNIDLIADGLITFVNIYDDWIFYLNTYTTDEGRLSNIYKVRIDGTEQTRVSDVSVLPSGLVVDNGWIYFGRSGIYLEDGGFYKRRINGSQLERISDDVPAFMNIHNDWIYYLVFIGGEHGIYRIHKDGTGRELIRDEECNPRFNIAVVNQWVYLIELRLSANMNRIRKDGTQFEVVFQTFYVD